MPAALLSQLKRRYSANQNRPKRVTPHFPFPSMGNERSRCLTHLGKDYGVAFRFLNSAPGHPSAGVAHHCPGARLRRGQTVGEERPQETTAKEKLPLPVPQGECLTGACDLGVVMIHGEGIVGLAEGAGSGE